MKFRETLRFLAVAIFATLLLYGLYLLHRGFTTAAEPSRLETIVARAARNFAIPRKARLEPNPWKSTPDVMKDARESYIDRCSVCHPPDGSGQTNVGRNEYPRVPDLRAPQTENLTDEQLRYIIRSASPSPACPAGPSPTTNNPTTVGSSFSHNISVVLHSR